MEKKLGLVDKSAGFIYLLVGKPGCGKTTRLRNLLTGELKGCYDYVLLCSPSHIEYEGLIPESQRHESMSIEWLYKSFNLINVGSETKSLKVLVILDDVISDIKKKDTDPKIVKLFFNRRHILWNNGRIDIIITSQKYTMMPAKFRSCLNYIELWSLCPIDITKIYDDLITTCKKPQWIELMQSLYNEKYTTKIIDLDNQLIG